MKREKNEKRRGEKQKKKEKVKGNNKRRMKREERRKEEEEFTTEKLEEDTSYLRYAVTEEGETERAFLHTKPKPYESAPKSDSHLFNQSPF